MKHESSFKREPLLEFAPGNLCVRVTVAKVLAKVRQALPIDIAMSLWPNDKMVQAMLTQTGVSLETVQRAASAPAMTTVSGWAAELAIKATADAVDALSAASAAADLFRMSLLLNWNGAASIVVPAMAASANNASFVAEGDPIPVRQLTSAGPTLLPYKVASIAVLSREMLESSNAEAIIADALISSAALAIDSAVFDANAATSARPAGLRSGISTTTASANADPYAAFLEDVSNLLGVVSVVGGKGPYALVANPGRVGTMGINRIADEGFVVALPSGSVGNIIIAVAAPAVAAAIAPVPDVETANAGTLVMDTAPGAVNIAGPSNRELFQTDSIAIKIRWPVSWILRSASGVAWTTPSWK